MSQVNEQPVGADESGAGDDLVTAIACATEFEAATKVAVLEEEGIEAFVFGAVHASLPLGQKFLAVPVQVRAADLERARHVLAENRENSPSIDWDAVDVGTREDELPLRSNARMPWLMFLGYVVAVVAILTGFVLAAWWLAQPPVGWLMR